jgi:hypothetical protein
LYIHAYIYVRMYWCVYVRIYVFMYVFIFVCMYVRTVCMYGMYVCNVSLYAVYVCVIYVCMSRMYVTVGTSSSPARERRYGICIPTAQTVTLLINTWLMVDVAQGIQDDL